MSSFDGIANKFDKNIYGTTKGKLRHQLLCHYLADFLHHGTIDVVDVGGGTGVMAAEFAAKGHRVLNLDVSEDVLAIAKHRLAPYENAKVENRSLFDWQDGADLIICHAVLEWLDDPLAAVHHLLHRLPSTATLSLSFFNHHAKLLSNVVYGNFDYIKKGMKVPNQVRLSPHNPLRPEQVMAWVDQYPGVQIVHSAGIRCFHDYVRDKSMQAAQYDELLMLEKRYGCMEPYKFIGKYFHCLIRKH